MKILPYDRKLIRRTVYRLEMNNSIYKRKTGPVSKVTVEMLNYIKHLLWVTANMRWKSIHFKTMMHLNLLESYISVKHLQREFCKRCKYSRKKITIVKTRSLWMSTKHSRVKYIEEIMPYLMLEMESKMDVWYVDESSFNVNLGPHPNYATLHLARRLSLMCLLRKPVYRCCVQSTSTRNLTTRFLKAE